VRALPVLGVAVVLALVALLQALSARPAPAAAATNPAALAAEGWQPVVDGADIQTASTVDTPGARIEQRQYNFLFQHQGKELGGYTEDPTGGEELLDSRQAQINDIPVTLFETRDPAGDTWLIAATYQVGAEHYATSLPAKVRYARASLLQLRSEPAALTLWRMRCIPDCPAAQNALDGYIAATETED
jgi:hypothetical protein